jgi:hypothetical protein
MRSNSIRELAVTLGRTRPPLPTEAAHAGGDQRHRPDHHDGQDHEVRERLPDAEGRDDDDRRHRDPEGVPRHHFDEHGASPPWREPAERRPGFTEQSPQLDVGHDRRRQRDEQGSPEEESDQDSHERLELSGTPGTLYIQYSKNLPRMSVGPRTAMAARLEARAGSAFALFDGRIEGRQIELVPGERVGQAWRFGDAHPDVWEPGVYSIVPLHPDGGRQSDSVRRRPRRRPRRVARAPRRRVPDVLPGANGALFRRAAP